MTVNQPKVLDFPGYPYWKLFFCTCWLQTMKGGVPTLPAHVPSAITINRPDPTHIVDCPACRSSWFFQSDGRWRLQHRSNVDQFEPERMALYKEGLATVEQENAERLDCYNEGLANEMVAQDQVGCETEVDFE